MFVYRTIDDLEQILDWAARAEVTRAAVIGGGLLGLEAAKATVDLGLETHVIEMMDRLMGRQLDETGGALLRRSIESLGVHVHTQMRTEQIISGDRVEGIAFDGGARLDVDMIVVSAGIIARDELARAAGLAVGERGGVVVDDHLCTSDAHIHAIGECAQHSGTIYGLVAPGYDMARILAQRLAGEEAGVQGRRSLDEAQAARDRRGELRRSLRGSGRSPPRVVS